METQHAQINAPSLFVEEVMKLRESAGCDRCRYAASTDLVYGCVCKHRDGWRPSWGTMHCANQRIPAPTDARVF